MSQKVEVNVDEKIKGKGHVTGKMHAAVTEATHAYLCTDALNVPGAHVAYRGAEFTASAHVHLVGGTWELDKPIGYYGVTRVSDYKDATPSQRKTIRAAMLAAWADTAATIPEVLIAAEAEHRQEKIERAEDDVEKAEKALEVAKTALEAVKAG
jgi:hypothetical protein